MVIFDVICLLGIICIAEGLREIYPAAVPLYAGLIMVWLGITGAKRGNSKK